MIDKARVIIHMAKGNIREVQGYLKQKNKYSQNTIRTFQDAMRGDKELIASMNEFIKARQ